MSLHGDSTAHRARRFSRKRQFQNSLR
jgi:hypothetical protein